MWEDSSDAQGLGRARASRRATAYDTEVATIQRRGRDRQNQSPPLSRFRQFFPKMQRCVCADSARGNGLGRILVATLDKGHFGEGPSSLLGSLLLTQIALEASSTT
jgi:predicted GNAT superfamily acetyltransferase